MTTDPWVHLKNNWPNVPVYISYLPGYNGFTVWTSDGPVIYLAHTLGRFQRRCTLAHEIQHLERGMPCAELSDLDEERVNAATARWLLPDLAFVCTTLRDHDVTAAAIKLSVTRRVLLDRLDDLNDSERTILRETVGTPSCVTARTSGTAEVSSVSRPKRSVTAAKSSRGNQS